MATVVSSVPEASSASSSTDWLGAPPVPMTRRDPSSMPSMARVPPPLATLDRREQLDRVARANGCFSPAPARQDLLVECDGDAEPPAVDGGAVRAELAAGPRLDQLQDAAGQFPERLAVQRRRRGAGPCCLCLS